MNETRLCSLEQLKALSLRYGGGPVPTVRASRCRLVIAINIIRRLLQVQGAEVVLSGREDIRAVGRRLSLIETAGAGQGGNRACGARHVSLYVMTSDYGGPMQLERPDEAIDCAPARTRETARGGSLPSLSAAGCLFQVDRETMFELS